MNGDFSKPITQQFYDDNVNYDAVFLQQGRVQVDADWNALVRTQQEHADTIRADAFGECSGPANNYGFLLSVKDNDLVLSKGRLYVDGRALHQTHDTPVSKQSLLPAYDLPESEGVYLAYLCVWEQLLNAAEDPQIADPALQGQDTSVRTRLVPQVKLLPVNYSETGILKDSVEWEESIWISVTPDGIKEHIHFEKKEHITIVDEIHISFKKWHQLNSKKQCGQMAVSLDENGPALDNDLLLVDVHDSGDAVGSKIDSKKGYSVKIDGDNQLKFRYSISVQNHHWRVGSYLECFDPSNTDTSCVCQITDADLANLRLHVSGDLSTLKKAKRLKVRPIATVKWSAMNGSAVIGVTHIEDSELTVDIHTYSGQFFTIGSVVELNFSEDRLYRRSGLIGHITAIVENKITVDFGSEITTRHKTTPLLRLWDHLPVPISSDTPVALNGGIHLHFSTGHYLETLFWQCTTRGFRQCSWPGSTTNALTFLPPDDRKLHRQKLALCSYSNKKWRVLHQWQEPFLPLSDVLKTMEMMQQEINELRDYIRTSRSPAD